MRLSTIMGAVAIASASIAALGLWGFYRSFDPIPTTLHTLVGKASAVRTATLLYSRSHATFTLNQLNGENVEFSYAPRFVRFYYFADHLKEGMTVEATIGPGGKHDFWGLKLGSEIMMTPEEAYLTRRRDGYWALVVLVVSAVSAVWIARDVPNLRQKGL